MLEIAQRLADEYHSENVHFMNMDAENLTFPDNSWDIVCDALGLMYLADPAKAVSEMYRVLNRGGRAAAAVWGSRKNCGWAEVFPIVDKRVTTEVCPMFFQMGTGNTLARTFEGAGFSDIDEYRISGPIRFKDDDDACNAMLVGGPVALSWNNFDKVTRQNVRAEYLDSLGPYKESSAYRIPAEFVIVTGKKTKLLSQTPRFLRNQS